MQRGRRRWPSTTSSSQNVQEPSFPRGLERSTLTWQWSRSFSSHPDQSLGPAAYRRPSTPATTASPPTMACQRRRAPGGSTSAAERKSRKWLPPPRPCREHTGTRCVVYGSSFFYLYYLYAQRTRVDPRIAVAAATARTLFCAPARRHDVVSNHFYTIKLCGPHPFCRPLGVSLTKEKSSCRAVQKHAITKRLHPHLFVASANKA